MKKWLTRYCFCPSYLPFWSYGPLKKIRMKSCQQDISKSILPRSLKLGQLIEDEKWITGLTCEQILSIFSELRPFENLDILNLSASYLENFLS